MEIDFIVDSQYMDWFLLWVTDVSADHCPRWIDEIRHNLYDKEGEIKSKIEFK